MQRFKAVFPITPNREALIQEERSRLFLEPDSWRCTCAGTAGTRYVRVFCPHGHANAHDWTCWKRHRPRSAEDVDQEGVVIDDEQQPPDCDYACMTCRAQINCSRATLHVAGSSLFTPLVDK